MALRPTAMRSISYNQIMGAKSMYTTTARVPGDKSTDYMNRGQITNRRVNYFMKRQRPWWKQMPKYKLNNSQLQWFEPLPSANYLTWKADGIYTVPAQSIITLEHVLHLKMLPVKMVGRTFSMPLVRWLIGAHVRQTVGSGKIKNIPEYKLTKPKYWAKS
eukprot:TRINITY_DN1226_c1_g1_i1.p1 TRINITY_DN1226_c1_g1~~TRINITY_DN1226_c1_g1_i1.p1  ORF type:complete len:181 (+),score=14.48 TRINITY_DN1226_c1_g1_i1:64-543(+)